MEGSGHNGQLRGGIDLGGTKIEAIVVDDDQKVLGQARQPTPDRGRTRRRRRADGRGDDRRRQGGRGRDRRRWPGSASARPATSTRPRARWPTPATSPAGRPPSSSADTLSDALGTKVYVGNDVQVATEAEFKLGAGKPYSVAARGVLGHRRRRRADPGRQALAGPRRRRGDRPHGRQAQRCAAARAGGAAAWRPTPAGRRWRPRPGARSTRASRPTCSSSWSSGAAPG